MFAVALLTTTVILGIANAKGAIDSPMLTWVSLTSAIAVLSELYRRYSNIKARIRNPLDLFFASSLSKTRVQQAAKITNSATLTAGSANADEITAADESRERSDWSAEQKERLTDMHSS